MERQNRRKEQPKAEASAPVQPAPAPSAPANPNPAPAAVDTRRKQARPVKRDDFDREERSKKQQRIEAVKIKSEKSKK